MCVSRCRFHFKHSFIDNQQRNVESSSSQIKNQYLFFTFFFFFFIFIQRRADTVCQSGSSRLIDNPQNIETSNGSCIFCSLALSIVEIRWASDDSPSDLRGKISFCDCLHLRQYHSRDFLRRESLLFTLVFDFDEWLVKSIITWEDVEWPKFSVFSYCPV